LQLLSGKRLFESPIGLIDIPSYDPLELPDSADDWLDEIGYEARGRRAASNLLKLIVSPYGLDVDYNSSTTFTVTQSFNKRSANCLSYSMLVLALANKIGFDADIRLIDTPLSWDYIDDSQLKFNRHVNVAIRSRIKQQPTVSLTGNSNHGSASSRFSRTSSSGRTQIIVGDINAPDMNIEHLPARNLKLNEVRSLYFSNRASELIIAGDVRQAFGYLNRALSEDSDNSDAWVNIGIIYRRANHFDAAEVAYLRALNANYNNYVALQGLSRVYNAQNRLEEAQKINNRLTFRRAKNPYYHFSLAKKFQDSPATALKHLDKAIQLAKHEYRFYYFKAVIHARQGDKDNTMRALTLAKQYSPASQTERFSGKLASLE